MTMEIRNWSDVRERPGAKEYCVKDAKGKEMDSSFGVLKTLSLIWRKHQPCIHLGFHL